MRRRDKTQPQPRIQPDVVYRMGVQGAVLVALERTLFIRADGGMAQCVAHVRNGEAKLTWRLLTVGGWRAKLARRLLGFR